MPACMRVHVTVPVVAVWLCGCVVAWLRGCVSMSRPQCPCACCGTVCSADSETTLLWFKLPACYCGYGNAHGCRACTSQVSEIWGFQVYLGHKGDNSTMGFGGNFEVGRGGLLGRW
jgi:hypothetical protein